MGNLLTRDSIDGPCSSRYMLLAEVPIELTVAISLGIWTWSKSRIALKSHDDGEGRLVLLPAYQVNNISPFLPLIIGVSWFAPYFTHNHVSFSFVRWYSMDLR
jgi:hypothetical protein